MSIFISVIVVVENLCFFLGSIYHTRKVPVEIENVYRNCEILFSRTSSLPKGKENKLTIPVILSNAHNYINS